jgi:hypothetical protein
MSEEMRSLRRLRARYCLLLACLGWACSAPAFLADDDVRALVSRCHDSPGAPVYVLPLAWVGLVLGIVAFCWGGWQVVTVLRRKTLRLSPGHAVLCAVLPLAVVAVPFQMAGVQTAAHDTGPQRSACFGSARPAITFAAATASSADLRA